MEIIDYALAIIKQFYEYNPAHLDEADAEHLLLLNMQDARADASDLVSDASWRDLPGAPLCHAALISLAQSMGTLAFCKCEVCKLILNRAKPAAVKRAWLSMPAQFPEFERDIPARRLAEANLYLGEMEWYLDPERHPKSIKNLSMNDLLSGKLPSK